MYILCDKVEQVCERTSPPRMLWLFEKKIKHRIPDKTDRLFNISLYGQNEIDLIQCGKNYAISRSLSL